MVDYSARRSCRSCSSRVACASDVEGSPSFRFCRVRYHSPALSYVIFAPVCSFVFYMVVQKIEALPTGQRKRIETRKRSWIFHQI